MVFSSLHFLYIFLPVVMLAHRFAPPRLRNGALLAASIWFYAWSEPVYVGLMLFSVAWNYLTGLQLDAPALGPARGTGGRGGGEPGRAGVL